MAHRDTEGQSLFCFRLQQNGLFKFDQLFGRLLQLAVRLADINLHNLLAGCFTGVFHLSGNVQAFLNVKIRRTALHRKSGIGKAVAERIGGLDAEGLKITVAYIQVFFIDSIQPNVCIGTQTRTVLRTVVEIFAGGNIVIIHCPGIRQLAGRVCLSA